MPLIRRSEFPLLDASVLIVPLLASAVAWFYSQSWLHEVTKADPVPPNQGAMVMAGMMVVATFFGTLLVMAVFAFVMTIVLRRRAAGWH